MRRLAGISTVVMALLLSGCASSSKPSPAELLCTEFVRGYVVGALNVVPLPDDTEPPLPTTEEWDEMMVRCVEAEIWDEPIPVAESLEMGGGPPAAKK